MKVTLDEMYNGSVRKLQMTRSIKCEACTGSGSKSGRKYTCEVRGRGFVTGLMGLCGGARAVMAWVGLVVGPGLPGSVPQVSKGKGRLLSAC